MIMMNDDCNDNDVQVLGDKAPRLTLGATGSESDWPYQGSIEVSLHNYSGLCPSVSLYVCNIR